MRIKYLICAFVNRWNYAKRFLAAAVVAADKVWL